MPMILAKELDAIKRLLLTESAKVEEAINLGIRALLDRNTELARQVIKNDDEIDRMEIEVEEEVIKTLALHQPVAGDLRFLIAVLKINNDLERMGDIASNIAKRADFISSKPRMQLDFDFPDMAAKAQSMVKRCIDALVERDSAMARQVIVDDTQLDRMRYQIQEIAPAEMEKNPDNSDILLQYVSVARHLERLGDIATNISEDVIYMVEGEIIRHRMRMQQKK